MIEELKPCPFCGEIWAFVRHKIDYIYGFKKIVYWIECPTCGVRTKKDVSYTDTVELWNKRTN